MSIITKNSDAAEESISLEIAEKKPLILHLDDDGDFLELFMLVFNEWLDIVPADNGETAFALLKEKQFDAVVTDYDMPGMNGLEFLNEVRSRNIDLPLIFYTGQGNEEIAREAFIMGATDYFSKDLYSFAHKEKFVNSINNAVLNNRTEKARADSDIKFRELFHGVNDAIFLYKIENGKIPGKFIEVNDIACRRLGYSREELLKMTPADINAYLQESQVNSIVEIIASKGRITLESAHRTKDGRIIPVEISSHIITLNNKKAVLSVARDISERQKHRKILKESEEKFRLLYNEAPMPYQSLDENGNFIAVNNTWLDQLGYSKKEVIGKNFGDFLVPADRSLFDKSFGRFKEKGEVHNRVFEMVKKDGSIIAVEFEGRVARDEDGNFKQTHCIFQDITKRLKAEKRVRHLNRVLKAIRNVNQLIVKEKNRDVLTGKACELLIENNGYNSSWIVLMDENRNYIKLKEAGLLSRSEEFYRNVKNSDYPRCILSALNSDDVVVVTLKEGACSRCPEQGTEIHNTRMSVRLEHGGRLFGVLVVSIPSEISVDEEEKSLFIELADDIAYALSNLEIEEKNLEITEALSHREEILSDIFNNINSGIVVYEPYNDGEDFIFRQFNRAAQKIENIEENALLGKRVCEVFPGVRDFGLFEVFLRVWKSGIPEHHALKFYSDGRINGWRDNFVFKLSTGEIVAIYEDITEQKKTEDSLNKSRELFRKILDTIPACIFVKDREGKYLLANEHLGSLFGFATREIIGKGDRDLIAGRPKGDEETEGYLADDHKILNGTSDSITTEEKYTNREGKVRYFRTTKVPISVNEERDSVLGVGMDITDLHELNESLRIRDIAMESSLNAIAMADLDFNLTYANEACLHMWGYENENEVLGLSVMEFWKDKEFLMEVNDTVKEKGGWKGEMEALCKDGSTLSVYLTSQVIFDTEGNPVCILASFMDISQRKAAEKAIQESEKKYRTIFESTGTAIAILEEDMTISLVNSEYERLSGYKASEAEGKMSGLMTVHPDDREMIADNHRDRRNPDKSLPRQYEFRFFTKSKETKYVLLTVDMIPGTTKSVLSMIDITHLKEIEQELRKSRNELKSIIKNMPVMMNAFDENLLLTEWNRECERVTGFNAGEIIGNSDAMKLLYPDEEDRNYVMKTLDEMPGDFRDLEIELTCKNGDKKTVSWSNISDRFPIPDWYSWAIGVDVTKRKEIENKLIQKNRELNDFAHTVSHDLKNPLFIIMGFLNIIKDNPSVSNSYIPKIIDKAGEMMRFIDNLLNLSRAGKIIDKKEKIDFSDLLYTIFLKNNSEGKNAEIILPKKGHYITADRAGINSVFTNLITNSFRYRDPEKDKLIIEADYINEGNTVRITYRDNGIGISQDNLEKIFEPGFTASKNKGTGFGLPIVKKITEAHGGSITAQSDGLGKGIEFIIKLPAEE